MIVDLVDGTYELFRQFYGIRRFSETDPPLGAALGVVRSVVKMLEDGSTHLGVATDHVIESFRNDLWDGYKTGEGIDPALFEQFHPLEEALVALGVAVWPMVELEADDALGSAARLAAADDRVDQVRIWTPDKDLGQVVEGDRVVQVDRKSGAVRNEAAVAAKFGVPPERIPDYLALVGDAADGYPGIPRCGAKTSASLIARYGPIENFPDGTISDVPSALLFKRLATLRVDAPLFSDVDELRWKGPEPQFGAWADRLGEPKLAERVELLREAL